MLKYFKLIMSKNKKSELKQAKLFDFKNEESQKKFSQLTENCEKLRECFTGNGSPKAQTDRFFKVLNNTFHQAFKKIRI